MWEEERPRYGISSCVYVCCERGAGERGRLLHHRVVLCLCVLRMRVSRASCPFFRRRDLCLYEGVIRTRGACRACLCRVLPIDENETRVGVVIGFSAVIRNLSKCVYA